MKHQKLQLLLLSLLLVMVVAALILRRIELPDASERLRDFPTSGPAFSSKQMELTEFEEDMLGEANALKAVYAWHGMNYVITIIDGTHDRQAVHDPRYCFRGAGWDITDEQRLGYAGGFIRKLILNQDGEHMEAVFFYSDGETAFDKPSQYWLRATKRRWLRRFGGPEPLLVMIRPLDSSQSVDPAVERLLPLLPLP